jgi:two-component system, NtrC family, sensor kinase
MNETKGRALVIDDEPALTRVLQAFLERAGFATTSAGSAEEAEGRLAREEFDVIITDILLPGRSGLAFLKVVRELGLPTPVVLITGEPSVEAAIEAVQAGAYDFLVKPIERGHLIQTVARGVEKSRLLKAKQSLEEENRAYQRELEAQNQSLEAAVAERTGELSDYIEQLHQLQGELVRTEKLASLGQLTAGIAHEINNPLAFVKSNLGRLKEYSRTVLGFLQSLGDGMAKLKQVLDPAATALAASFEAQAENADLDFIFKDCGVILRETEEGVDRVAAIVRDLRRFSYPNPEEERDCELNEILESALNLTLPGLQPRVELIRDYGQLPKFRGSPLLLNQVFVNLILNAGQAVAGPGSIRVRTYRQDGHVVAEIQDSGPGIKPEVLPKIFDPFFTTKEVGQGTGLGLSISYGIIQQHHGTIEAKSDPGHGATFTVSLPLSQPQEMIPGINPALGERREAVGSMQ